MYPFFVIETIYCIVFSRKYREEKIVTIFFFCRRSASASEERFGTFGARTSERRRSAIRRRDLRMRLDTSGGERGERLVHTQQQGSNTRVAVSVL